MRHPWARAFFYGVPHALMLCGWGAPKEVRVWRSHLVYFDDHPLLGGIFRNHPVLGTPIYGNPHMVILKKNIDTPTSDDVYH